MNKIKTLLLAVADCMIVIACSEEKKIEPQTPSYIVELSADSCSKLYTLPTEIDEVESGIVPTEWLKVTQETGSNKTLKLEATKNTTTLYRQHTMAIKAKNGNQLTLKVIQACPTNPEDIHNGISENPAYMKAL